MLLLLWSKTTGRKKAGRICNASSGHRRRADKLSAAAARRPWNGRRRPRIVGSGGAVRPAHSSKCEQVFAHSCVFSGVT